jgi:hypothetical protein
MHGGDQAACLPGQLWKAQVLVAERLAVDELEQGHAQPLQPAPPLPGLGWSRPRYRQPQLGEDASQLQGELRPGGLDGAWPAQLEEPRRPPSSTTW